jgi:MinD superfamily P-loop ATPase
MNDNGPNKQIVIISGKGGTGKTTITAAFTAMADSQVIADCDVDAADLHILLKPELTQTHPYTGGKKAKINANLCSQCGICEEYCRFDAIQNLKIDPLQCEGCGFCVKLCPDSAIEFENVISGFYFKGKAGSNPFLSARLNPGEGNSGKLVTQVKQQAKKALQESWKKWMFVDGPPGIGCPVNATLSGADFILIVTEPTVSGLHDLGRIVKLIQRFNIPAGIIINKFDLNKEINNEIQNFASNEELPILGEIPFDETVVEALLRKEIVSHYPDSPAGKIITEIWLKIQKLLGQYQIN